MHADDLRVRNLEESLLAPMLPGLGRREIFLRAGRWVTCRLLHGRSLTASARVVLRKEYTVRFTSRLGGCAAALRVVPALQSLRQLKRVTESGILELLLGGGIILFQSSLPTCNLGSLG